MAQHLKVTLIDGQFPDYYKLLNVGRSATRREVTVAYHKLALEEHPDKAGDDRAQNELFAHVNNAKDILTDDIKRGQYDALLAEDERVSQEQGEKNPPTPGAKPKSPGRSTQDTKPGPGPSTPFHRFFAPQGARPDTESAWYKFKPEGDLSMGQIQTSACENAVLVCLEASDIQNIIASIEKAALLHINQPPTSNDPDDLHNRLGCAIELVLELMHFAAASYNYHKKQLDVAASLSPKKAWPTIKRQQTLMSKLVVILSATRCELSLLAPLLKDPRQSIDVILPKLQAILRKEWPAFCELPSNLVFGGFDTFFVKSVQWSDTWERRRYGSANPYEEVKFELKGGNNESGTSE